MIEGHRISPELLQKLSVDVSNPPYKVENADLLEVVAELSKRAGVAINVSDEVKQLPPDARKLTFEVPPGVTLMALLEGDLIKRFDALTVVYSSDSVLITTKAAAQTQPPASPAAPPAPAAPMPPVPAPALPPAP